METQRELLRVLVERYQQSTRAQRTAIIDEFEKVSGYHRKHVIRLLNGNPTEERKAKRVGRRTYEEATRQAVHILWETADRICGKRLKAAIPLLIESMERHGHLDLDDMVREQLLTVSASTIDRILAPARELSNPSRKRKQATGASIRRRVPVRTFGDWHDPPPGFFEADFVAHCGGSLAGSFVHSFVVTDVTTGWTDSLPLIVREQTLVTEALNALRTRLPVPMLAHL